MSESSSKASKSEDDVSFRKIFIGGLGYNTDDAELNRHFSAYGHVEEAIVMKGKSSPLISLKKALLCF